jgi:WhiB family redox-sensing transcriptional regulator
MNYREFADLLEETGETPCMAYPDAFFIDQDDAQGQYYTIARQLCHACPIRLQCLEYAVDNLEEYGYWGGTTPKERKRLKRGRIA